MKSKMSLAAVMVVMLMGVAFVPFVSHQAEAQSIACQPQNLAVALVEGEPVLTWDAPTDCAPGSYGVYRRLKTDGSWDGPMSLIASGVAALTYTDTSAETGKLHRYRVKADIGTRRSRFAEADVVVPQPQSEVPAPPPPTLTEVTPVATPELETAESSHIAPPDRVTGVEVESQNLKLRVTWDAPNANGSPISNYRIEWGIHNAGPFSSAADSTTTEHTILGLTNGERYKVRVRAKNGEGDGLYSAVIEETPWQQEEPLQARSLSTNISDMTIAVTWQLYRFNLGPGTFVRYEIKYGVEVTDVSCDDLVGTTVNLTTKSVRAHTLSGLTNGTTYRVCFRTVSSVDGVEGPGTWRDKRNQLVTLRLVPPEFELSTLSGDRGAKIQAVECTSPVGCPDHYQLEYKKTSDALWPSVFYSTDVANSRFSPNINTYNVDWLEKGESYDFRVRSIRSGNRSGWSSVQTIQVGERPEDVGDPVIRVYFNEYETERDSNGNIVMHDHDNNSNTPDVAKVVRVNEIDVLEGYTKGISVRAECDPCGGVGKIIVPLYYTYNNDVSEAVNYQDRVEIRPSNSGQTETVSLRWNPDRQDLPSDRSAQVRFGKITYKQVDKLDNNGDPVQECEARLDSNGDPVLDGNSEPVMDCVTVRETVEDRIVRGLDILYAREGDSGGQGTYLNISIHDHDNSLANRYVISNSATEHPANLDPRSISGPTRTADGVRLIWEMKKIHGVNYYDWNADKRLGCHLTHVKVESKRNLTVPGGHAQATNITWHIPAVSTGAGNIDTWTTGRLPGTIEQGSGYTRYITYSGDVYVDYYNGNGIAGDQWNRFTFTDLSTVGRSGTITGYTMQGLFRCGGISRYGDKIELNRQVSLP